MNLSITDLKKGTMISLNGFPWRVTDYSQKSVGRGGSIVNVKLKNMVDGSTLDKTYKGNDAVDAADVNTIAVQYLYSDDSDYYFMRDDNFETIGVPFGVDADAKKYLTEGLRMGLLSFNNVVVGLDLPKNVELEVIEAQDVVKGNTTGSLTKIVTLSTGIELDVPQFIKQGDVISVDTSNCSYRERIKQ